MLFNLTKKLNIKKFTNKLFTIAAVAAALLGTGASVGANSSTVYAHPRYHRVYRRHRHARRRAKKPLNCGFIRWEVREMLKGDPYVIDYSTATAADEWQPLSTSEPKVYIATPTPLLNYETSKALAIFHAAGIYPTLTSDRSQAQVVVEYVHGDNPNNIADTEVNNSPRTVEVYLGALRDENADQYGLRLVLEHELCHAMGLKHDRTNVNSIISPSEGCLLDARTRRQYKSMPHLTYDNIRVLREMYQDR